MIYLFYTFEENILQKMEKEKMEKGEDISL